MKILVPMSTRRTSASAFVAMAVHDAARLKENASPPEVIDASCGGQQRRQASLLAAPPQPLEGLS